MTDTIKIPKAFTSELRIVLISALINGEKTFSELKKISQETDGYISTQLSKLEEYGYVKSSKEFENKKPKTTYSLTEKGRDDFENYVMMLTAIIKRS